MDLSKAFDCISHDLLIAKLNAYGFHKSALKYIYSYLKGRRQCVKINGICSTYLTLTAGVPKGSILGPIFFNIFINDFYHFFTEASLYGFADDHTLSAESKSLETLKAILSRESNVAIDWLNNNKMLANPSKFQLMILSKSKQNIEIDIEIDNKQIQSKDSVHLLGIDIDHKLKFEYHISELCRKAGGQLNSLFRFRKYLTPLSKKLSITSFISSNFCYCPLVWHFSSAKSQDKIERIQKRSLKFLQNNNTELDFDPGKSTMKVKRLRVLATEIFKTLNNLNPLYMNSIFYKSNSRTSERLKFNIQTQKYNQAKFGKNSIRVLGPILWNSLPNSIKSVESLIHFKKLIKTWGNNGCPHFNKCLSYFTAIN